MSSDGRIVGVEGWGVKSYVLAYGQLVLSQDSRGLDNRGSVVLDRERPAFVEGYGSPNNQKLYMTIFDRTSGHGMDSMQLTPIPPYFANLCTSSTMEGEVILVPIDTSQKFERNKGFAGLFLARLQFTCKLVISEVYKSNLTRGEIARVGLPHPT